MDERSGTRRCPLILVVAVVSLVGSVTSCGDQSEQAASVATTTATSTVAEDTATTMQVVPRQSLQELAQPICLDFVTEYADAIAEAGAAVVEAEASGQRYSVYEFGAKTPFLNAAVSLDALELSTPTQAEAAQRLRQAMRSVRETNDAVLQAETTVEGVQATEEWFKARENLRTTADDLGVPNCAAANL